MTDYREGLLAKSLAGRDKDNLFIIFKESGEYVYLVDGKTRTIHHPKCKNKKHVQLINREDETLSRKLTDGIRVTDEEIKRFIKCCKREDQSVRR